MISNRLKLLRQANALSLQDLSEILSDTSLSIGRAALSHYELGVTIPTKKALETISKKLGTTTAFFYQPDWDDVSFSFLSNIGDMHQRTKTQILSFVQIELEKYLMIDNILSANTSFPLPQVINTTYTDRIIEDTTEIIRKDLFQLGKQPIASVTNTLERVGFKTIEINDANSYITGYEHSKQIPFILFPSLFVVDDFRFSMLESVGYIFFQGNSEQDTKNIAGRFARAMLLPQSEAYYEFGKSRETVSVSELALAKQKYGISKRQIMKRLLELNVISKDYFDSFEDLLRLHGFPKKKQILAETLMFFENPTTVAMRVLKAKSLGLINKEQVSSLLINKEV